MWYSWIDEKAYQNKIKLIQVKWISFIIIAFVVDILIISNNDNEEEL